MVEQPVLGRGELDLLALEQHLVATEVDGQVFVDNDPSKGLRKTLLDFNLRSEPWLFVMDAEGRVAARLEGSSGLSAFEAAVRKGLDGA